MHHHGLKQQHHRDAGKASGESPAKNGFQEGAGDGLVVGLQSQEEGGHADGKAGDNAHVDGSQGVGLLGQQGQNGQTKGEDVLHQKQGGCPLDVVDHPPALPYDVRHGGKVRIQQHQPGHLTGGLGTAGHGDAAVRLLHGQHIVHAVAGHGYGVALFLQSLDEHFLLVGGHPPKDGVFPCRPENILIGFQLPGVNILFAVFNASPLGNGGNRLGVVTGDDLDAHPLLGKVGEGLPGLGPEGGGEEQQRQRLSKAAVQLLGKLPGIGGYQQHPVAGGGPGGYLFPQLFKMLS